MHATSASCLGSPPHEAPVERGDRRVAPARDERCHVQPARTLARPPWTTRRPSSGSSASSVSDTTRPHSGHAPQQVVLLPPDRALADHRAQVGVRPAQLALQVCDVGLEALRHRALPAAEHLAQAVPLGLQHLGEQRQDAGVDAVGRRGRGAGSRAHASRHARMPNGPGGRRSAPLFLSASLSCREQVSRPESRHAVRQRVRDPPAVGASDRQTVPVAWSPDRRSRATVTRRPQTKAVAGRRRASDGVAPKG